MFDSIDFKGCEILFCEYSETQKEDLLLLKCANGRLIDVGWHEEDNKYCITVIQDEDWANPCYRIWKEPQLKSIERHLQRVINFETAAFDTQTQELFSQITNIIDNWRSFQGTFNDIISILERLRDTGISQDEAADYIGIYAIKYIDSDEEIWDIACDILDRITGWCAPEFHIWRHTE